MEDPGKLKELLTKVVRSMFPEMAGYQFPIRARVVKLHEEGGKVTDYDKRYSVDVQPLGKDGSDDVSKPVIPDVPVPVVWAGGNRGIYCLPKIGAIVRVAFYYWDAAMPYVDAVLPDGYTVPEHAADSLTLQQDQGTRILIEASGEMTIETGSSHLKLTKNGLVTLTADTVDINGGAVVADISGNVSLAGGGQAIARVGDAVQCPNGLGKIIGGSGKATCGG